ncbi:MAG: signal peptide peptidase SppA [Candidatus Woesearchaeota archaeon]
MKQENKKYWVMFLILGILLFFSFIISIIIDSGEEFNDYNTAIISIKGVITVDESPSIFSDDTTSSTEVIELIEKAKKNPNTKAIIFEINSPGGSPVATDEISEKIKSLKEYNITTVSWIRESGLSGAYWIASSTDYIIANRMSFVGSIGVIGSYIEWYGLMQRYNVSYKRLVAGDFKDTGTPFRPMTEKEEIYIQSKLNKLHDFFIEEIAKNRNMSYSDVKIIANGEMFLGVEAKDIRLIDALGSEKEALYYVESKINEKPIVKKLSKDKSFFEKLMNALNKNSFYIGQGIGDRIINKKYFEITT